MKMFPPFDVHFYREKVTDFPICSPLFNSYEQAYHYAATHYLDCRFVRIGFWYPEKYPERCYHLIDVDVQRCLF